MAEEEPAAVAGAAVADAVSSPEAPQRPVTVPPSVAAVTEGKNFVVRIPGYKKSKIKKPSDRAFYDFINADLFSCKKKTTNVIKKVAPPWSDDEGLKETKHGVPEFFIINLMFPNYEPPNPVWGKSQDDGAGYSIVFYFKMSDYCRTLLEDPASAPSAVGLLKRFCEAAKAGKELKGRLKGIPKIVNLDDLDFGAALNQLVRTYNAKPFLTGPKFHSFCSGPNYLECDVDIHRYCYMARKAAFGLMGHLKNMVVDFGIVVEGHTDDELPEQVLGCLRVVKIDPSLAKPLDAFYPPKKDKEAVKEVKSSS